MSSIQRFEFTTVYTHPEATVDIVFLHGLHGSPSRTWRANPTNSDGTAGGVFWPTDLLPKSLEGAPANIILYGYNADLVSTSSNPGGPSQSYMVNHAQNLVTFLTLYRQSLAVASGKPPKVGKTRPILWVVHSLGGILLKAALNYSNGITDYDMDDQRGVYVSTYGMIFLGTPHVGTDLAEWGLLVQRVVDAVVPKKLINTEGVLLKTLRGQSETIVNINHQFNQIKQRFKIHYAYETLKTSLKGIKTMVVEPPDAVDPLPGAVCYGIESTHSDMCRFDSPTAPGYFAVSTGLRDWVLAAPTVIQKRWEFERDQRWRSLCLQVTERFMEMEAPSDNDLHPYPPSIDEASSSGAFTLWNASSPSLLAPPTLRYKSSSGSPPPDAPRPQSSPAD
ncbi:hypothetical protein F5X68DRAFT_275963 [Plectosphaerella plurivora]|uniref:DUF676 domain-containing protein n=1 Tax=Plectosphaerella plurivora TaxID=936078 RepID=A0A9P8VCB2_9PEZI|nr:hypothetical protein F5X68DRAFT_275963 [Plectosphaerella plurivora]